MQFRVLLVESDLTKSTTLRRRLLAAGYALECLDNYPDAAEFLLYDSADVAILSSIPGDALPAELCAHARQTRSDSIQLLVLGPADQHQRILSYRAGADDYVCQDSEADAVALRLTNLLKDADQRRNILGLGGAIGAYYLLVGNLATEGVLGALQVGSFLSDEFRVTIDGGFLEQGNLWVKNQVIVGATYGTLSGNAALTQLYSLRDGCFRIVEEPYLGTTIHQPIQALASNFKAVA